MSGALDRMGRRRALEMYADWTGRIIAGEVPSAPPRPEGVERNVVVNGSIEFIEVWNEEAWARYSAESEQSFSDAFDESLEGIV